MGGAPSFLFDLDDFTLFFYKKVIWEYDFLSFSFSFFFSFFFFHTSAKDVH